jgi:hypothetical protein
VICSRYNLFGHFVKHQEKSGKNCLNYQLGVAMSSTSSNYAHALANLKDTAAEEERVEVNQRALIDKILARYASANAVYRELIQNSNDAEATIAEIHFTTSAEKESDIVMDDPSSTGRNSSRSRVLGREIVRQGMYSVGKDEGDCQNDTKTHADMS